MPESTRGWALRVADLLGTRPEDATEEDLSRMVAGGVREDADLDFKQERYGNSDPARRDLAGDVAAMANTRGGLIIIGIRDEDDVAVELTQYSSTTEKKPGSGKLQRRTSLRISPSMSGSCTAMPMNRAATTC